MKNKTLILIFSISFFLIGGFLMGAYIYTHTDKTGYVPPTIYVRVIDSIENPVENASCFADIETEKGIVEDRPLEYRWLFRELECYGREKCPREDYFGYYKLEIANYSYKPIIKGLPFFRMEGAIYGDFQIMIVCRTETSVAHYEFNRTNFPCSPMPLTGNYKTPDFYCSSDSKKTEEHAYNLGEKYFDEYDAEAIGFINNNYKDKVVLSNNKLAIVIYSQKINKPVGIINDKFYYKGDPYLANVFWIENCTTRKRLAEENKIDLILSRFDPGSCDFMKEVYSDKNYVYEVLK